MLRELLLPLAFVLGLAAFNALLGWLAIISINGLGPRPKFSTRGLLLVMTITALMLGLIGLL